MRLSVATFNRFLDDKGQTVSWSKATRCPCFDPRSGEGSTACGICFGSGKTFAAAVSCIIAFSGMDAQKAWQAFGRAEVGDLVVTIGSNSAAYGVAPGDKIVLAMSSVPFSTTGVVGDSLVIPEVVSVDPAKIIVDGVIVSKAVTWDDGLVWSSPAPAEGTKFTLSGRKRPVYHAYTDLPRDRAHFGGLALPRLVVLRVHDLPGRVDPSMFPD